MKFIPIKYVAILGIASAISLSSCTKWDTLTSDVEGTAYMTRAYSDKSDLTVYKIDSLQTYTFGASVAGFHGASGDATVTFEVDTSLIAPYNEAYYYLNKTYVPLPEDAYTISSLTTTIKSGHSDSDPVSLVIDASKLDNDGYYMLPVRIKSISNGSKIDSTLGVSYFKIDGLTIRSRDVTYKATLTVSNENSGGASANEGSPKLVDGDLTSKFLSSNYNTNFWTQLTFDTPIKLDAYTLTSGNDAQDRDPYNWQFQASDDGTTWTTLDNRVNVIFTSRRQTQTFELNQPDGLEHLYYRLLITSKYNGGTSGLIQITEWSVLQYY